jgi:hypothetical protein
LLHISSASSYVEGGVKKLPTLFNLPLPRELGEYAVLVR